MATLGEVQYICNAAMSQDGHKAVVAELYELGSTLVVTIHRVHKKRSAINAQLTYETSNQTPLDSIVVCARVYTHLTALKESQWGRQRADSRQRASNIL